MTKGLNDFARECFEIAMKREEKQQIKCDTMSMLKHCAGEVCEAMEAWASKRNVYVEFGDELADIITCALIMAARNCIDIEMALKRVKRKNEERGK